MEEKAGLPEGYITKVIEDADSRMSLDRMANIADALGYDITVVMYKRDKCPGRGPILGELLTLLWEGLGRPYCLEDVLDLVEKNKDNGVELRAEVAESLRKLRQELNRYMEFGS